MRKAFSKRLQNAVDQLAEISDRRTIEAVLSIPDPISAMTLALQHASVAEGIDPLVGARIRGIVPREQLIEVAGGLLQPRETAASLGVTPQALTGRPSRREILAVPRSTANRVDERPPRGDKRSGENGSAAGETKLHALEQDALSVD